MDETVTSPANPSGILLRFDFPDEASVSTPVVFRNPLHVLIAYNPSEVQGVLQRVEEAVQKGLYAAGFVSYEAAPAFDPAFPPYATNDFPLAWFALFDRAEGDIGSLFEGETATFDSWEPDVSRPDYEQTIESVRDAIARGETYQANYTFRMRSHWKGDDYAFYCRSVASHPAPYSAYLNIGRYRICSFSPELFFEQSGETIITRPMKGTMPRGRFTEEDSQYAERLAHSEKDRAENVMITDLLRNDLGRIAQMGTVAVPHLFTVERYPTVWQMTSTVTATLQPETTLRDIFTALFPCGSVTGAPKVRTLQLLSEWERSPRQVYCGAIGFVAPSGRTVFNVAIRTLLLDTQTGEAVYGVGGGVTYDSTPAGEYAEALTKARIITEPRPAFSLLETMRLERGEYTLLSRHLHRLQFSADYFSTPVDMSAVEAALQQLAESAGDGPWRVRLLVSQKGEIRLEHYPLNASAPTSQPIELAATPIDSQNPFLFHKTTHRAIYEVHSPSREGTFDVLLWNERGELTEFTRGNLVLEKDGKFYTPPLTCGLLAGTLREELLASGVLIERVLEKDDLQTADALYFVNSLRGWIPVFVNRFIP